MTKKEREEFLSRPCEDNVTWVAQQIAALNPDKRYQITIGLKRLNEVLYKSWAKELSLNELTEAVNMLVTSPAGSPALNNMNTDPNAKATEATNEQATEQESAVAAAEAQASNDATQEEAQTAAAGEGE